MDRHPLAEGMLGLYGQRWQGISHAVENGLWTMQSLFARRFSIAGGTDEVQKNIIAERQLGLPK